jgi:hypothetical protein
VRLRVSPVPPVASAPSALGSRALLRRAVIATLEFARWRQYEQYLGNPDPSGRNRTTYEFASQPRGTEATPVRPSTSNGRSVVGTLAIAAALLAAAAAAVVLWSRA